jgi:hypothetical protein
MAFRAPPPQYYTPPPDRSFGKLMMVIVVIVIVIVAIVLYISLRRLLLTKCRSDIDCPSGKGKCDRELGTCYECLRSTDCPTGLFCSTINTCL